MKSELHCDDEMPVFPVLYRDTKSALIVRFTGPREGTVVNPSGGYVVNEWSRHWIDCRDAAHWTRLDVDLGPQKPAAPVEVAPAFPALYKARESDLVVLFTGVDDGTVVHDCKGTYTLGECTDGWVRCTDTTHWRRLGPEESVVLFGG